MTHPENPLKGLNEAVTALGHAPPFEAWFTPPRAFILLTHLQLALQVRRDTFAVDEGFVIAAEMYQNLKAKLCASCPQIQPFLEQGEDFNHNVTKAEFEAYLRNIAQAAELPPW